MKQYSLFVFILILLFCSCSEGLNVNTTELKDQKQLTTIEMQESLKSDTVRYKLIERNGSVYLVNPNTNLVEKTVNVEYNILGSVLCALLMVIGVIALMTIIFP